MPIHAVQQFMLGTVLSNENEARQTLAAMKAAGYDGIELCGFMIHPIGFMVRLLTKAAGMPVGKGGNLDWHKLVKDADLQVVSLHTDLGSLERDAKAVADEAKSFGTKYVVITGMYRFDYGDEATMHDLAARLNKAGAALKAEGVELLYHNHNCELRHVNAEKRAYDILLEETDPQFVNFEFDSYWFTEGGANALASGNPHEAVAYQRPRHPPYGQRRNADFENRQHGVGHRECGPRQPDGTGAFRRRRCRDFGKPPQLGG